MLSKVLTVQEGLGASGRLRSGRRLAESVTLAELAVLWLLGTLAALVSAYVKLGAGIPGHNILRVVFLMAFGLALVPRRGSASVMGLSGLVTAVFVGVFGRHGLGLGAATSLIVTGFLVDVALLGSRSGRSVYLRLALAGLSANMLALAARGCAKLLEGDFALWWPKAVVTYPACGLIAGLVSAAVWFRFSADDPSLPKTGRVR